MPINNPDQSPTADVYSGDVSRLSPVEEEAAAIRCFHIRADSEPGTFARIANVLNIANTAPRRVTLEQNDDGTLSIYIELAVGLSTAESLHRKLSQLTDVLQVDGK